MKPLGEKNTTSHFCGKLSAQKQEGSCVRAWHLNSFCEVIEKHPIFILLWSQINKPLLTLLFYVWTNSGSNIMKRKYQLRIYILNVIMFYY